MPRRLAFALALSASLASAGTAEAASCFDYDDLGRVVAATYENGVRFTYSYDANGNRTATSVSSGQTPTCPDPGNYGPNTAPTAIADSTTARPSILKSIDVRANDTDLDGDPLTVSAVTTPAKGTAVIANGKVDYTANAGATGTDSFSYTVIDGRGGSATTTVNITAFVANSAPVAVADSATVAPSVASTLTVRTNDTDADGDALTLSNVSTPSKGATSISSGNVVYTANANTTGNDTFNYTVIDGHGGSSTTSVAVTINRPPVAVADTANAAPSAASTINVRANDSDPDNDTLTVAGTGTPSKGTAAITNNNVVYTANAGTSGTDTFSYTVADGKGGSASANITVTIGANQPPTAVNDSIQVDIPVSSATTFDPRWNDSDPNGHALTVTAKTNGAKGTVAINGTGTAVTYTYTATLPGGGLDSDSFTYTVSDGYGGTAVGTVSVSITGPCTPPPGQEFCEP